MKMISIKGNLINLPGILIIIYGNSVWSIGILIIIYGNSLGIYHIFLIINKLTKFKKIIFDDFVVYVNDHPPIKLEYFLSSQS